MEVYPKIQQLTFKGLGTEIDLQIVVTNQEQSDQARRQLLEMKDLYVRTEKTFSRFDPESELSKFNGSIGTFSKASAEMIEIVKKVIVYNKQTRGIFDPRILQHLEVSGYDKDFDSLERAGKFLANAPEEISDENLAGDLLVDGDMLCFKKRLDFSGIVKGWITDKVAEFLSIGGWKNYLIDSGGDIFFAGFGSDGKKWRVDVEGIAKKSFMFELSDLAVATSGIGKRKWERSGKRFHHLINPQKNRRVFIRCAISNGDCENNGASGCVG